jgi:murein DD-endopeptidase MepM/ murein hydrolase activator NlpD
MNAAAPFLLLLLCGFCSHAQQSHPVHTFCHPLDIPLEPAGTFGEVRSNHLHSGLDLRTAGKEGLNVFAVGDGYISRIKVSAYGYGNALYITHPEGYVSVYGHLKEFGKELGEYVRQQQYAKESFEADLFPQAGEFPVRKGEIIGLSGNTGGSERPHLHFELRDRKTEEIINPLLLGYEIQDSLPPVMKQVVLYPKYGATVKGLSVPAKLPILSEHNRYTPSDTLIPANGWIGFGIECLDPGPQGNKNGIYALRIYVDGELFFSTIANRFAFDQTRYVNAMIDYAEKTRSGAVILKSNTAPNNQLKIIEHSRPGGLISVRPGSIHKVEIRASDFQGNTSSVRFTLSGTDTPAPAEGIGVKPAAVFPYQQKNIFETSDLSLVIPPFALYDTLLFEYAYAPSYRGAWSKVHTVHNKHTALQSSFTISIKPLYLPENLKDKAVVCLLEKGHLYSQGGSWRNGYVSASSRSFGDFVVVVDTLAPEITPLAFAQDLTRESGFRFRVKDDLSGIKSYRATVDGKWILMEPDSKTSSLEHRFDGRTGPGEHELVLTVSDEKKNTAVFRKKFIR